MANLLLSFLGWIAFPLQTAGESSNKNLNFLFAAYVVVWLLIVAYLFSIGRRQKRLDQEIEVLKQMKAEK